jgi:hypothetical protein
MTVIPASPTVSKETTYRTKPHGTERLLRDWNLKERLAFNLESSRTVAELQACLPESCKQQLGELKPTETVFRKMSSGFNNVSDVWIELMRFIGVWDFSPEQAILGTVSTFLDKENVRIRLNVSENEPSRKNSIELLCLNEPIYQGSIGYEGDRLSFPPSIFEAVIERRLNVYQLYCENLSEILLIPQTKSIESDELDDSIDSLELEAARIEEAARDAHLDELAEERDAERMADVYSGSDEILDV